MGAMSAHKDAVEVGLFICNVQLPHEPCLARLSQLV